MSGLYIHIPFCKQACHYCNFHFSTSLKNKDALLFAMKDEMSLRKDYLTEKPLQSLYFGGGTPSILDVKDIAMLIEAAQQHFGLADEAEVTLEANPDDLDKAFMRELKAVGVNRLSIGVQSFQEEDLKRWNRAHNSTEALKCLQDARDTGFDKLTADLIYGAPEMSMEAWEKNIDQLLAFDIEHLSCYALTVEEKTALSHFIRAGQLPPMDEELAAAHFEFLMDKMEAVGYEHYEISNFAKAGHYAVHNTSYWQGAPYLGIGPAAHSYNLSERSWNIANNAIYIKAIEAFKKGENALFETEEITSKQAYNEYILTGMRTKWGCKTDKIKEIGNVYWKHFEKEAANWVNDGHIFIEKGSYKLSRKGKLLADMISAELFY